MRLRTGALVGALVLAGCHSAPRRTPARSEVSDTGGNRASRVRFTVPSDDDHIYLRIEVQGVSSEATLDTGADSTCIDGALASRLQLRLGAPSGGIGAFARHTVRFADPVTVSVGDFRAGGVEPAVFDFGPLAKSAGRPLSSILGLDVLARAVVDFDFDTSTLTFIPHGEFRPPAGATRVPLRRIGPLFALDVSIEGGPPLPVLLDTGSGSSLSLFEDVPQARALLEGRARRSRVSFGVGGKSAETIVTARSLQYGPKALSDVPVSVGQRPCRGFLEAAAGYVGFPVISRFRTILDLPHSALYLVPRPQALAVPLAR